jgi:Right handed beta helix region
MVTGWTVRALIGILAAALFGIAVPTAAAAAPIVVPVVEATVDPGEVDPGDADPGEANPGDADPGADNPGEVDTDDPDAVRDAGQPDEPAVNAPRASAAQVDTARVDAARAAAARVVAARVAAAKAAAAKADAAKADAAARARQAWETHGRPAKLIIVRKATVDTVLDGQLTAQQPRAPGVATPAGLAGSAPSGWITTAPGATRISAAILLSPDVVLELGTDAPLVQLSGGGATAADAATIHTGGGQLSAHGVTVTSLDPVSGQPMAPGPGRPFVAVGSGGRLLAADATFSDLGATVPDGAAPDKAGPDKAGPDKAGPDTGAGEAAADEAGVGFAAGSNGSLARITLARNSIGLLLNGSSGVRLDRVSVVDSVADGLVLRGDRGTTFTEVRADRNAGNGVLVTGPSTDRPVTGITTSGNGEFGVAVVGQTAPKITDVVTQADRAGGLVLSGGTDAAISGFSAIDQPTGVLTHVGSTRPTLNGLRIRGGGRGVAIEKTTTGLTLSGSTIDGTDTGVSVGGHGVALQDVAIGNSRSGVRIERGAGGVVATGVKITGGQDGVVAVAGTTGVVLRDLVADGVANNAVRTASPDAQIVGGRITGGTTGITAEAATTISGTRISGVEVGIRTRSTGPVRADSVDVSAVTAGISADEGSPFVLTDSRVGASEAVSGKVDLVGHNDLSLPPLNMLGVVGIPLIVLALILDQVQRLRQRRCAARSFGR